MLLIFALTFIYLNIKDGEGLLENHDPVNRLIENDLIDPLKPLFNGRFRICDEVLIFNRSSKENLILNFFQSGGLKIINLSVPRIIDIRNSAILICDFDLETSKLYSVKWYKDDLEFCRFIPGNIPDVQIFKVDGIHTSGCNITSVELNPLEYISSGLYTCEVSTDAPYFKTVQTSLNMTVLGMPQKVPVITGIEDIYAVGDYVVGNCTSDGSYPPADLFWYINNNQVESWQLENYPAEVVPQNEYNMQKSTLGLFFQVDHSHFVGKGNTMMLRCVAKVSVISRQISHISKLADLKLDKIAQELFGNYASRANYQLILWLLNILFIATTLC